MPPKPTSKVKRLKDGRFKFTLDPELRSILFNATASALHFDANEFPDYLFALLQETLETLRELEEPRLHRSQVLAMLQFSSKYIDGPTQVLIVGMVQSAK
ncbi:hypothetical protein [Haliscomenobacter hydrossis]|nr:hypothetical protein [Haliscomenobacter hydrossis]